MSSLSVQETRSTNLSLEAIELTKRYPGIVALDRANLAMAPGRVHALLGENGAGKSTLIKILSGVIRPDGGEIHIGGRSLNFRTPQQAWSAGIRVVHQQPHLIPDLSVAENFALQHHYPHGLPGIISWNQLSRQASEALSLFLPNMDVKRLARSLSGVERQMVELSFAMSHTPSVLILDEPTSALPHKETLALFDRIRQLTAQGTAVLFVSHRLDEVFEIAQDVTVLRDGKLVWTKQIEQINSDDLIRAMVGRVVNFERDASHVPQEEVNVSISHFSDKEGAFEDVNFEIRKGEIFGVYGLVGAGQSELCQGLFGLRPTSGQLRLKSLSQEIINEDSRSRVNSGMAYVPADRHAQGVFAQASVEDNLSIAAMPILAPLGWINRNNEKTIAEKLIEQLRVKTQGREQLIGELSGGNQQKVLLGRWIMVSPDFLILEEPTQGVDVGAKSQIHNIVRDLAKTGVSVMAVSSELPELMALSHRVAIFKEGKVAGIVDTGSTTEPDILKAALPDSQSKKIAAADQQASKSNLTAIFRKIVHSRDLAITIFSLLLAGIFAAAVPNFARWDNIRDILINNTPVLIGALAMTAIIIAGGIDVSVGAILGMAAIVAGKADQASWPIWAIAFSAIGVGFVLGLGNGLLSVAGRVHPIVITLGMLAILRAVILQITGGYQIFNLSKNITWLSDMHVAGLPLLLPVGFFAVAAMYVFLGHTAAGRRLYVLGGDRKSAEYLGVYINKQLPLAFAVFGCLVGLAGLIWAGRYGQIQTNVGIGFEMKVIAAAVIGGTHIMGGRGGAIGTFFGTLFLSMVNNVLTLTHVSAFWENTIVGTMILLALATDFALVKLEERTQ